MMIISQNCIEQGLPTPKSYDTQLGYIKRCIGSGYVLNSRLCSYIGIAHLHSYIPVLRQKGLEFSQEYGLSYCPARDFVPPYLVDIIYMTVEQQNQYREEKKPELV